MGVQINGSEGNVIATKGTFSGDVGIGGTLTYEDVTNVDSVGVITARSTIDAQGDVSIADKIVHTGDTNTAIRFPAADTITAETAGSERLRIDANGHMLHGVTSDEDTSGSGGLRFINTGDVQIDGDQKALVFRSTNNTAQTQSAIEWWNENGAGIQAKILVDRTAVSQAPSDLVFYTNSNVDSGADGTEKLRITSDGKVGINQDTPRALLSLGGTLDAQKMLLYDNDGGTNEKYGFGIQANELRQFAGGSANLTFGHISSSDGSTFDEKLRITSGGDILSSVSTQLFGANTSDGSDNKAIMINGGGATSDSRGGYMIVHGNEHASNPGMTRLHAGNVGTAGIEFYTAGSKRMTIDSNGYVTKPAHPAFRAGRATSTQSVNGADVIIFNSTDSTYNLFNQGGHYSTSTGKFTAPVAGVYSFFTHVIYEGVSDGANLADVFYMYVNNSRASFSHKRSEYVANTTGNNGYYTDTGDIFAVKLAANDEVWVRHNINGMTVHPNPTYTTFSGFLIG